MHGRYCEAIALALSVAWAVAISMTFARRWPRRSNAQTLRIAPRHDVLMKKSRIESQNAKECDATNAK